MTDKQKTAEDVIQLLVSASDTQGFMTRYLTHREATMAESELNNFAVARRICIYCGGEVMIWIASDGSYGEGCTYGALCCTCKWELNPLGSYNKRSAIREYNRWAKEQKEDSDNGGE